MQHSIYIHCKGTVRIIIPVFINDLTLTSSDKVALDEFVEESAKHFEIQDASIKTLVLNSGKQSNISCRDQGVPSII